LVYGSLSFRVILVEKLQVLSALPSERTYAIVLLSP
jgi:hypothetical protein